jgi:P27 family predicted phage terminase small subunit
MLASGSRMLPSGSRLRGRAGIAQRKRRLEAEPRCRDCHANGLVVPATVPDHIVPLSGGGTDDDNNIRCLCAECHCVRRAEQFGYRKPQRIDCLSPRGVGSKISSVRDPNPPGPIYTRRREIRILRKVMNMPRGRHPKHPEIRRLEGNPGKRPITQPPIKPEGEPIRFNHLCGDAQACMEVISASLPPGVLTRPDSYLVAAYATAWAAHKQASMALREQALLVKGSRGTGTANPLLRIVNSQARLTASLGARLGLDPASRMAIRVPDAEEPPSKFQSLLGPNVRRFHS